MAVHWGTVWIGWYLQWTIPRNIDSLDFPVPSIISLFLFSPVNEHTAFENTSLVARRQHWDHNFWLQLWSVPDNTHRENWAFLGPWVCAGQVPWWRLTHYFCSCPLLQVLNINFMAHKAFLLAMLWETGDHKSSYIQLGLTGRFP